jgi:hypothetical protein
MFGLHKNIFVLTVEMMFTRSRALEVCNRCRRAMNFLSYVALSVGTPNKYGYCVGLLSPEDQDVLIWLVSFIVL